MEIELEVLKKLLYIPAEEFEEVGTDVALPQDHTGKGASLRASARPENAFKPMAWRGRGPGNRKAAGAEVEVRGACGVGRFRPSAGVLCNEEANKKARHRFRRAFLSGPAA